MTAYIQAEDWSCCLGPDLQPPKQQLSVAAKEGIREGRMGGEEGSVRTSVTGVDGGERRWRDGDAEEDGERAEEE